VEELRSKLREGKAETWEHYGVARRTKSEVKKLQATEPLDDTSTGTARKTVENQRPEKTETPHLRSIIKLKSKEGNNTDRCKIQFFIELKRGQGAVSSKVTSHDSTTVLVSKL
jgi:hypothetical protein